MESEYSLYMTEEQQNFCNQLILEFKAQMKKIAEDVLNDVYTDVLPHIEHDLFINWRQQALSKVQTSAAHSSLVSEDYVGLNIRNRIFSEHKDELVDLMDTDILKRNKQLEEMLKEAQERNRRY